MFPHKAAFFAYKFKYIARGGAADDGWRLFDEAAEYTRIGLPGDQYRVTGAPSPRTLNGARSAICCGGASESASQRE